MNIKVAAFTVSEKSSNTVCHFLVVDKYDAHLSFHWVKLNKGRLNCTEIIWKDEQIPDVSYQNVT